MFKHYASYLHRIRHLEGAHSPVYTIWDGEGYRAWSEKFPVMGSRYSTALDAALHHLENNGATRVIFTHPSVLPGNHPDCTRVQKPHEYTLTIRRR